MIAEGARAPGFSLPNSDMEMVSLEARQGIGNVVLYFYPKDDTPGCTVEAVEFTNLSEDFAELNTVIYGVSRDDCVSHAAFRDKHGLTVQLLADVDGEVCQQYDVWQEKEKDGIKKMGIVRSTFIIDRGGIVRRVLTGVTARGHAAQVLNMVRQLEK